MSMPKGKVMIDVNDIIGKRLGKLEVACYAGSKRDMTNGGARVRHYYVCKCDCGKTKFIRRSQLKSEIVHSCGCSKRKSRK